MTQEFKPFKDEINSIPLADEDAPDEESEDDKHESKLLSEDASFESLSSSKINSDDTSIALHTCKLLTLYLSCSWV